MCSAALPVRAARPLLDSGKWDNYFALFARNTSVPWKRITLRLDTYSGAAVDFAAYDVDPTDVLVAGANSRPRAIDTSHLKPVARWRFTPPPGLTFASNDVEVPLLNHEGFYVVEARRGTAVQQVWLNLSRVGLLTKQSPAGSILYGADLGTGHALHGMRVTYLIGTHFVYDLTDVHGISRVPAQAVFALAEWGQSKAFVSLFPQSPPPAAVLGVRADRASATAGESVRVVGFVRKRAGNVYRPAAGEVALSVDAGGTTLTSAHAALDQAGAFSAALDLPANAPAGDAVILAAAQGASGGATIHIDGSGDTVLGIVAPCTTACPPAAPIPLVVTAKRAGVPAAAESIRVRIVRSPHVQAPDAGDDATAWGVTTIVDTTLQTDPLGVAHVAIPAPSDGLASTYGIEAESGPSTASANLVAPDARVALAVTPLQSFIDPSDPATFDVRGFDALDGAPAAGLAVHLQLSHGPTTQNNDVVLAPDGTARVTFANVALGMNLVTAQADVDGRHTVDVSAITVAPRALTEQDGSGSDGVKIAVQPERQKPGDRTGISANLSGAAGDVLLTMESVRGVTPAVVPARDGSAGTSLAVPETIGALAVGAAFVRDGAIVDGSQPLVVDGPGHQRAIALSADRTAYAPGATAHITIADGDDPSASTIAVRVSDRRGTGGASFDDIPGVLASAGTTTQNLASLDPPWHTWVAPAKSTAGDIFGFDQVRQTATPDTIAPPATHVYTWLVERAGGGTPVDVPVPHDPGRYVLSIVKMTDDGDVGAASIALTVQ
ncbi:MAG: hypothetical protein ABSH03_12055 [Candidatus Lustribacter sp.]